MQIFKIIRFLCLITVALLAFFNPDLITGVPAALAHRCIGLLQAVADLLDSTEESLLPRICTSVLLKLTVSLQYILQILQKVERTTTATGNRARQTFHPTNQIQMDSDAFPFFHDIFPRMIEWLRTLIVSVKSLDAPSLIQQLALHLYDTTNTAHRAVDLVESFQWVVQTGLAMVVGHLAAARLIAYTIIVLSEFLYYLTRIALGFCVRFLRLLIL